MRKVIYLALLGAMAAVMGGCHGNAVVRAEGGVTVQDGNTRVSVYFSDSDRRHIHDYYRERYRYYYPGRDHEYRGRRNLPPGLAKREHLPPGLAKRDRLPPGLSGYRLPHELDRRLSRLPEGVIRLRIGTDIVLMDERTRVILDVISDIPID